MSNLVQLNALAQEQASENTEKRSQCDRLIKLTDAVELYHTPDGDGFATVQINGHSENWRIRSKPFRSLLRHRYYQAYQGSPGSQALQDALGGIEARAQFDGQEEQVHLRVAGHRGAIYLDLTNDQWQVVEITPEGWRVLDQSPVKFTRTAGMTPLPTPQPGGTIDALQRFSNLASEEDFRLLVAWLIAALRPDGPYPILVLNGEQGTGKSTLARMLRNLVDPNVAPIRTPPREEQDLLIAGRNSWIICLDNLSGLSPWLADGLCRLSTGGGFSARQLYTDTDEVLFEVKRPVILNGIPDLATRPDLADRAITLTLPAIINNSRKREYELWQEFDNECPRILGVLLDAVSCALRRLPEVNLESSPRMVDLAHWATAAEPGLGWPSGAFMEAYSSNLSRAVEASIEADAVAEAVMLYMSINFDEPLEGTASELLHIFEGREGIRGSRTRSKFWPQSPSSLSNRLRRAAPGLRQIGIEVELGIREGSEGRRIIRITKRKAV